ncbi:hypothetical protein GOP47_0020308 [Adiantum capillus-veneris]|uniref:F-box domain-containing protein n=1 Tax=Adiantum capillus-veneris TaxID=13818 RepID=A0A9D4UDP2_ADICA|nr:hypothetical protein GOP47_0020308 [Adiantum capillus-veneris]
MATALMNRNTKNALHLDEGLLCRVLASLPLFKLLELRSVCKLWNSVFKSRYFSKLGSVRHENCSGFCGPWLVMMVRKPVGAPPFSRELIVFNSALGTWISLEALLPMTSCSEAALEPVLGGPSCSLVANHAIVNANVKIPSSLHFWAAGCQGGLACFLCPALGLGDQEAPARDSQI